MLIENLKRNKEGLTPQTYKTYTSIINNIAKKINKKISNHKDIEANFKDITEFLNNIESRKRKTLLAALLLLALPNKELSEKIRKSMMEDIEKYKENEHNQERTEKQQAAWIEWDEVKAMHKHYEDKTKHLLNSSGDLSKRDFYELQKYIILSLYTIIPPLRSLNFTEMKIKNINKNVDNYRDKNEFVFNVYKNSNKKGRDVIQIPTELKQILIKWENINDNQYLLIDTKGNKLNQTKLNNILNNIFDGKNIGPSMLRHIYLTHKYNGVNLNEIKKDADNMQHSIMQNMKYIAR